MLFSIVKKKIAMRGIVMATPLIIGLLTSGPNLRRESKIKNDAEFVATVTEISMMEIQLGELALRTGHALEVRELGRKMSYTHSEGNAELKNMARQKEIELPGVPDEKKEKRFDQLAKLDGHEFDMKYTECLIRDHKELVKLCNKEAQDGKDDELKRWASARTAVLNTHLQRAGEVLEALKSEIKEK